MGVATITLLPHVMPIVCCSKCGYEFNRTVFKKDVLCWKCQKKMKKENKAHFRIIGDVHGHYDKYVPLTKGAHYTLQVGDMGFDYSYIERYVNSDYHKFIGGNHDNYSDKTICEDGSIIFGKQPAHFLGEYGTWEVPKFGKVFFVRGAWSIDKDRRTPGINWWPDEELTESVGRHAIKCYEKEKPEFVVAHVVPKSIVPIIPFRRLFGDEIFETRTDLMLDIMFNIHQPKVWVFGHYHLDWDYTYTHPETNNKTRFICLNELSYKDFDTK